MIRLFISMFITFVFTLGYSWCLYFYPEAFTERGMWDASNDLVMNFTSLMLLMAFVKNYFPIVYEITYLFDFAVIWFSIADVSDRALNTYKLTKLDPIFIVPSCIILASLTHILYVKHIRKKTINKQ